MHEAKTWRYSFAMLHIQQAQERIKEFERLSRARQLLDAISLLKELLLDGSNVEILSLASTIAKRFKFLGILNVLPNNNENYKGDWKEPALKFAHTGIYHCCTFCSSGGRKESTCGCRGTMPGGYKGCGHGHAGHPGVHHWSCCGSIARNSHCSALRKNNFHILL